MCSGDGRATEQDQPAVALAAAVGRYRGRVRDGRTGVQVGADLVALRHVVDVLEVEFARDAHLFAQADEYSVQGSVSACDWIRHQCGMSGHAAARALRVGEAEALALVPASVAAVDAGRIGFGHLALLASTAMAVAEPVARPTAAAAAPGAEDVLAPGAVDPGAPPEADSSPGSVRFDEAPLLALAQAHSVGRFQHDCHHVRHAHDAEAFLDTQVESVTWRRLELLPCGDGRLALRGLLDAVGGAALRTALEPLARRHGLGDVRQRPRRLADALVELCHHGLDAGVVPGRAGQRTHLQVTTTLATMRGVPGAPAGELAYSLPIAAATVQRLACDADVIRILLGADSAVLDVGRALRVPAPATRRALIVRDKGCVWPGCERPATWTQVHHVLHWARHRGGTDRDNLVLLCWRHHEMVHEGRWQVSRSHDGTIHVVPDIADLHRAWPRAPDLSAA